jgi:hypothetical protein
MRKSALLGRLYKKRIEIGDARQSRHSAKFRMLQEATTLVNAPYPYELPRPLFRALYATGALSTTPEGHSIKPSTEFLYRLTATAILVHFTQWIGPPSGRWPMRRVHAHLLYEARRAAWLPLSDFCRGEVAGPRGFTWWSSLSLYTTEYPRAASRAGIPKDKLPAFPVLLRIRADQVEEANPLCVPTVIDAFDSSVFNPIADDPVPMAGETISLEGATLARGCDEYVIAAIPVARVEMLPLRRRHLPDKIGLETGSALWRNLIDYD